MYHKFMKWGEFFQALILYIVFLGSLIYSIITLTEKGLDTYFLITFIIAILTIILSIYYSGKTNEVFEKITEKIKGIEKDNEGIKELMKALSGKIDKPEVFSITGDDEKILDDKIKEAEK